ncbi:hypothetical protein [Profundibacter sp.]
MLAALKKSRFGIALYRLSKRPVLGMSLRFILRIFRHERLNHAHLSPVNRAHNARQIRILRAFESQEISGK